MHITGDTCAQVVKINVFSVGVVKRVACLLEVRKADQAANLLMPACLGLIDMEYCAQTIVVVYYTWPSS